MDRRRLPIALGPALAGLLLAACGGGSDPTPAPPPPPPAPPAVASVRLNRDTATVIPQQTVQLTATPLDGSGNALSGRTVTWQSSATGVATVSADGLVTGVTAGTAVITATSESKTKDATVTVREGAVVGGSGGTVTAASGNVSVAVPAGALSNSVPVSVTPVASPPANPKLVAGTAYEFGPDGTTFSQPVTIKIKYDASNVGAATPANFRLHKYANGAWNPLAGSTVDPATRTVTGQTSSFSLYAVLEVVPVAQVTVTPGSSQLLVNGTQQLAAAPKDAQGNPLTGRAVTWSSSNTGVATVSGAGLVTAVAQGSAVITATSETIAGTATVEVVTPTNIPTFEKPFTGEYPVGNFLDHDIPKEFVDNNGTFTTFWGEVHANTGRMTDGHSGYDFSMPVGAPILAVAPGVVKRVDESSVSFFCPPLNANVDNQKSIFIEHTLPGGTKVQTWYVHNSRNDVSVGQTVTAGQQIALAGNTGCSSAPHLHFEVYLVTPTKLVTIDPFGWAGSGADPWTLQSDGATSIQLWKPGKAPKLGREVTYNLAAVNPFAPAFITKALFEGIDDAHNPNNEYVELTIDLRFTASHSTTGMKFRFQKAGLTYNLPAGLTLNAARPTIRFYVGSGTNTADTIYLGQPAGIISNLRDDCIDVVYAAGGVAKFSVGGTCQ